MQRIGFIVSRGTSGMGFAAVSVFEVANILKGEDIYEIHFLSERGGSIPTSIGMRVETEPFGNVPLDTLIVAGIGLPIELSTPDLLDFVRQAQRQCRRVAAQCTGAFVLAEAGLLDGRHATTHWRYARELQARFPKVKVDEDRIFINDGPIWTSAGMSSGIDLALALLDNDLGPDAAKLVARLLVMNQRR